MILKTTFPFVHVIPAWFKVYFFVGFTFFIAHEFFDALPIHKFVKVDSEIVGSDKKSWREILIDIKVRNATRVSHVVFKE